MDYLSICRVCLIEDVRMQNITNSILQDTYEMLTATSLETKDGRPLHVCYICCARLRNCYQLQASCLHSEDMYTQMLQTNMLKPSLPEINGFKIVHPLVNISFMPGHSDMPEQNGDSITYDIKMEPLDIIDEVQVKEEIFEALDNTAVEEEDCIQLTALIDAFNSNDSHTEDLDYSIQNMEAQGASAFDTKGNKNESQDYSHKNSDKNSKNYNLKSDNNFTTSETELKTAKTMLHKIEQGDKKPSTSLRKKRKLAAKKEKPRTDKLNKLETVGKFEENKRLDMKIKKVDKYNTNKTRNDKSFKLYTDDNVYKCDICEMCFKYKQNLRRHILLHYGDKPYKCVICKKCYSRKSHLIDHNRVHTGELPYKCNLCEKSFSRKTNLDQHINTHTSAKPYKCKICGKCLKRKENLMVHIRTHTGEKPYKCVICEKYFSHKINLKAHTRKVH